MRKSLLILTFILLNSSFSIAQEWFPVGAKWHYNWRVDLPFPPWWNYFPEVVEVTKDTVVLGRNCKQLVAHPAAFSTSTQDTSYVFDSLGVVYYYPPLQGNGANVIVKDKWSVLWDFTKAVGDTIFYNLKEVDFQTLDTITYFNVVDRVSHSIINGDSLKSYWSTPNSYFWPFRLYFETNSTEVIGGGPILFGRHNSYLIFETTPGGLRCYEDSILGFYQNPHWQYSCDTLYPLVSLDESSIEGNIVNLFPNPTTDLINIRVKDSELQSGILSIINQNGKTILSRKINSMNSKIDVSMLKPGLYFWKYHNEKVAIRDKLIISK
jgi:hypothetical protein